MKNLNFKHRVDGKREPSKSRFSRKSNYRYAQATQNEYLAYLESLDQEDLFRHSVEAGIVPVDNVDLLRKRLMVKFSG